MAIEYYSSIDLNLNSPLNLVVQHLGSAPTATEGRIYYDTGDDTIYLRTGSAWVDLAGGDVSGTTFATDLKIGRDAHNLIDFSTDDAITFRVGNADEITLAANEFSPTTSDGIALGTTSKMWSDLFLASGAVVNFNNGDVTATHSANTLTIAGGTLATAALTTSTIVASGVVKTDDTTDATSTTDGSLQTDGGLSVALDAIIGNDLYLLTDSSVLGLGVGKDATLTHDGTTGLTIAANPITITSGANVDINATTGITVDATTMSIDGDDDSNITVTGSAKDLDIAVAGGGTQELRLASAGTGASALDLTTSAGGMDINSADMITVDAADEIVITTTSADGHISLV